MSSCNGSRCRTEDWLAARLWLPIDAETNPVPAILEYIPYRRRDGTRVRDEESHAWVAAQGYVRARSISRAAAILTG